MAGWSARSNSVRKASVAETSAGGKGIHPKVVSEMLGHSQVGVTLDLYSHVTPTMHQQAAMAFDDLLRR